MSVIYCGMGEGRDIYAIFSLLLLSVVQLGLGLSNDIAQKRMLDRSVRLIRKNK